MSLHQVPPCELQRTLGRNERQENRQIDPHSRRLASANRRR